MNTSTLRNAWIAFNYTLFSVLLAFLLWVALTVIFTSAVAIMGFIVVDFSASTYAELRELMRTVVMMSGAVAGVISGLYLILGAFGGFWKTVSLPAKTHLATIGVADRD